jgi:hypothetical protein
VGCGASAPWFLGEVGMMVAEIGLSLGIVRNAVCDAVLFMAIATKLITRSLLEALFKNDWASAVAIHSMRT